MTPTDDLRDRVALVTGAGEGIGRAVALELARAGADVVVSGRRAQKLEQTCALARAQGWRARPFPGDLTSPDFPAAVAAVAPEIDVLVHNATSFPPYGLLEDVPEPEIQEVHEVAVFAPMRLCARFLAGMKRRRHGRIVFVGSIAGTTGAAQQAAYCSAKAALHGLVKSLALEGASHGITCNLVEPGLVLTERVRERIPEARRMALVEATPMGRPGEPEEIAALVAFLCSPRASYVTGAAIPVTGGLGLGLVPPRAT